MNGIFLGIVLVAFAAAAVRQAGWSGVAGASPMETLGKAMVEAASGSVTLALGMVGVIALFLGVMKVAEKGGLLVVIARTVRPLMVKLFPGVPGGHPAMGAMVLNISANVLGLGNAATPFGIRAMLELDKLNPHKGTASDAMAMFLVINTASVTLLPTGVIALRAAAGSQDPAGIVSTTLFATIVSTAVAIVAATGLRRFWPLPSAAPISGGSAPATAEEPGEELVDSVRGYPAWVGWMALGLVAAIVPLTIFYGQAIGPWIMPTIMAGMLLFGWLRGVPVYEAFIEGAKEGFEIAVRIIPYLVAILVAIAMLRESGVMGAVIGPLGQLTAPFGVPGEALTMGILRSLSGSGAFAYLASALQDPAIGPDSYTGYLLSTIQGSTETTFYVLAVYFGAVQVKKVRHALAAGLIADVASIASAVVICWILFGGR
ncbi:MAG: spore maturation protein [Rhodospirillales bacterium RIFCSPLOWO2_12_FULL_67_15]|nr:MAG: spore maturation protein [Rhodospirillales bacterium RIFCSPLOWO2_12_FULL_67_15]